MPTPIQEKHARFVLSPWVAQGGLAAPVIVRGEGCSIYDDEGKAYYDLGSGLIAVNLGHGHPKVVKAIQEQAARLGYAAPSLFNKERAELAEELSAISPWGAEGCRTFFTTAGAEANDDALRLAQHLTGRRKVLSAYRSFHGSTGAAITLTGEDRRWGGEPGVPGVVKFFAPYPYRSPFYASTPEEESARAIEHLERVLVHEDPKRVAAIFIEGVVGSNGVIVYPDGYLTALRALTERHGILLVMDEVMTGFGRTGAAFASTRYGIVPDMMTFAKGVTSAYVPLGGLMMRERLAKTFDTRALPSGHTYSGHPMGVAAGLATVRAYREEGLFERGREIEGWLQEGLRPLVDKYEIVGEVRGVGAFFAVEFVKNKASKEPLVEWHGAGGLGVMKNLYGELRKRGVYTFGKFNCTMVAPPLTTSKAELDKALVALDESIGALQASLG
ncbi:MAG: aminotransferase class III-fold pyridoxal phosphate-dependent enzyme [Myxococcales bacterium]|jgi:taurine--2-oxoglutarate transaminase|nr:aminotransferase class III-fold pyridoxal phosphate-dependent enzyme [Myxococcales bacterium]MBL0197999.1 aminotransferase class III-fold pyridoxal phosphate-dependent enzyme [Myxococcales bacterium]